MSDGASDIPVVAAPEEGRRSFSNAAEYLQSQASAAAEAPAAAAAAAPAPASDDDDDALLGVKASAAPAETMVVAAAADAAAATPEDEAPVVKSVTPPPPPSVFPADMKMADLFGTFQPMRHQTHAEDPKLYDVLDVCHELFGDVFSDMEFYHDLHVDVDVDDHRDHVVTEHKRLDDVQPIVDVFGNDAIDWFAHDIITGGDFEHARVVECQRPSNPFSKAARRGLDEVWLLDMAKVQPNRQVLHLCQKPFDKNGAIRPKNTKREFFTPQSCIQWAKSSKGRVVSNARIVRWSDGSATLHVGADVYELPQNNERVLAMIARQATISDGTESSTMVEAVPVARHVTAIPARGRPSSVNEALVREVQDAQKERDPTTSLQYNTDGVPVIRSDTERAKAPLALRNASAEERFLEIAREERLRDQKKKGMTPMELIADELRAYEELCEATRGHTVDEVVRRKDAEMKAEKDRQKHHRLANAVVDLDGNVRARNKFDRDTGLQTADGARLETSSNVGAASSVGGAAAYQEEAEDELLLNGSNNKRSRSQSAAVPAGEDTMAELERQRSTINMPARPEDSQE